MTKTNKPDPAPKVDVVDETDVDDGPVENAPEPDTTALQLQTWGTSTDPISWAPGEWGTAIDVIRQANAGAIDAKAVQVVLDAVFPDKGYKAADVLAPKDKD